MGAMSLFEVSGDVMVYRGCQGCIGGWQEISVLRDEKGYRGQWPFGNPWGCRGHLGVSGEHQRVSGVHLGLAGTLHTQGPEWVWVSGGYGAPRGVGAIWGQQGVSECVGGVRGVLGLAQTLGAQDQQGKGHQGGIGGSKGV